MNNQPFQTLSKICFAGGLLSIIASIAIWFFLRSDDPSYAQRFGIFVGLWAPTFFILSGRFATQTVVERLPDEIQSASATTDHTRGTPATA